MQHKQFRKLSSKVHRPMLAMLLLLLPCIGFAQSIKFKHISNEEGLSNSTIETIFQDSRGFMWFGTRDGLNRYDGYEFTVYKLNNKDTNSISDNFIRYIYEDRNKNLWIGTSNGLNKFDREKNNFKRFKINQGLSNNLITSILEDKQGLIWIGTYGGGVNLYDKKTGKFKALKNRSDVKTSLSDNYVNHILQDKLGRIWVATNRGLNRYIPSDNTFQHIPKLSSFNIRMIAEGKHGILWLATDDKGLLEFNVKSQALSHFRHQNRNANSLGSDQVRALEVTKDGNLWIGGVNGGLNRFDPELDRFNSYQNEPGNKASLSQRTVSALFEDRQGNLWVGTHRGGINLYSPESDKFSLRQQEAIKNSISYNDVKVFLETSDGNLWIGTDGGGLNFLNRKTNTYKHYRYNPFDNNTLGSDAVLDILAIDDNTLLIGTWGGGLNELNPQTGRFIRHQTDSEKAFSISSDYVQKAFKDSQGTIWVGTYYGGLHTFDIKTGQFRRMLSGANNTRLIGNNIISINESRDGKIWIGTDDGGLNCYNLYDKTFSHYFTDQENKPDLRVLFIDSKDRLWVGQKGLYLFDPEKDKFLLYSAKGGLAEEFIKGITEDASGTFWISSSNGLTSFNPANKTFKKYNTADGLQGLEFEANAFLKSSDGEMFFGGVNGYNSFYPKNIKINKFIPPVYITDFQIFNKRVVPGEKESVLQSDISMTKSLELSHEQSTFSFSFAALNFIASENNQYAYKLEGFDPDWNYTGKNRKVTYTNIDPGDYTMMVRASNNDGIWNNQGASIKITIYPPYWQTWWFRLLMLSVIGAAIYGAYQFKRKLELKELEEEKREEIHQTQLLFFTNISHEFRTPLSLIIGPLEKLLKENQVSDFRHYYATMYRNATRLMSLINELMDFRKVEAGALKLKVIKGNFSTFIDEIAEEFSELASDKDISFSAYKDSQYTEGWFDRHVLEKIILNLVNNSLKYTSPGGAVSLELRTNINNFNPAFANQLVIKNNNSSEKFIYIRVADNGIGVTKESINHLFERYYRITESHLGSGVGLAFVKSLTTLHKGNIFVSSERNRGTEIIIAIPCSKDDYSPEDHWIRSTEEGGTRIESMDYKPEFISPDPQPVLYKPEESAKAISKHILIVDDNEELRTFLRESLNSEYQISEAEDGKTGIAKAKDIFPDLIISDVMMPGMNGIQFCRLIKEDIETSHIPFLILTAKDSLEAEIEGAQSGADFYFSKPISINLLQLTIHNIFIQRQKVKEHYSKGYHTEVRELVHSTKDKDFMNALLGIIDKQLVNPELDIEFLCSEIGMSRTKLYHKIKSITGQSIGEFIRTIRLRKAIEIMTHEDVLLTEVMYRVGIQTQSYFTKAFKKEFGKTPSQFLSEGKK